MSVPDAGVVEMLRMFELAKGVSGADFDRVIKMAELASAFGKLSEDGRRFRDGDVPAPYEAGRGYTADMLDAWMRPPELVTIKAAIPYMPEQCRRILSIWAKLLEIRRLLDFCAYTAAVKAVDGDGWRAGVLAYVRPHLSPQNQLRADILAAFIRGGV